MKAAETARYELPIIVDPDERWCFKVPVPKDVNHLAAFMGQMMALARAYSWGNDTAHTAKDVAAVWLDIFNNLKLCDDCAKTGSAGAEGDENLIRQNPDNSCELQTSIDGVNWCTFADISLCFPNNNQPGAPARQPEAGGGCASYQGYLFANAKFLVPTEVSTGDTVQITAAVGTTNDGSDPSWHCPDGTQFFAGLCVDGTTGLNGADPVPTSPHMSIIILLNGTPFGLVPGPFTVPAGYTDARVEYQLNDSDLTDNSGVIQLQIEACNNAGATFHHEFDFTTNTLGWFARSALEAFWVAASGWESRISQPPGGPVYDTPCVIQTTMPSRTLTKIELHYDYTQGSAYTTDIRQAIIRAGANLGSIASLVNDGFPPTTGTGKVLTWTGSAAYGALEINTFGSGQKTSTPTDGFVRIFKVVVEGQGGDPF
jgi:hypothetical protein